MDAGLTSIGTSKRAASADGRNLEERSMDADREDKALVRKNDIQDLPDECLIQILRCLGPVKFRKGRPEYGINNAVVNPTQCALVCKRWCALVNLGVDSLSSYKMFNIRHLLEAFSRWPCLRRLELGPCHFTQLRRILQAASSILPFLQILRLMPRRGSRLMPRRGSLPDICTEIYSLPHLTALELKCLEVPPLDDCSSKILHVLELVSFAGTKLPESLGLFTRLESLSIEAKDLTSLPTSITQLSRLTYLRVSRCSSLRACPDSLWNLRALRVLIWTLNARSEPLIDLRQLPRLKDLRAAEIEGFEGLPEDMGDLRHLSELELTQGGRGVSELPSSLVDVSSLQKLTIRACAALLHLPAAIGARASLREVDLPDCGGQIMVSPPGTVRRLNKLKILSLIELDSLVTLPEGLGECSSLTSITISHCSDLQNLPQGLGRLGLLKEISISHCSSLTCLPSSLGYLPMLQLFRISNCSSLRELPETLSGLTTLEELSITDCPSLVSLPKGLGALEKLQVLSIIGCRSRELPEEIGNPNTLKCLTISSCPDLLSLPPSLGSQRLEISDCSSLREFPGRSEGPALETIALRFLLIVSLSSSLGSFKSLKSLSVVVCRSLTELPESLGELRALEELKFRDCSSLASLPGSLGSLGKLTSLEVASCPLRELPESVGQLASLEKLWIGYCPMVSLPWSLGALTNLRDLSLFRCDQMCQVPDSVLSLGGGSVLRQFNFIEDEFV